MNLSDKIQSTLGGMTKSEYKVATYFLTNPNDFAFLTLEGIAAKMDISTTSVIRFCRKIGFSGYTDFRDSVRSGFKYSLTLPDKYERAVSIKSPNTQLHNIMESTVRCIEQSFNEIPPERLSISVYEIAHAKRVFCFGMKESFALAHYAYTRFLTVRPNVFLLNAGQNGEIESVLSLNENDLCVFFLFHRYTKQSLKILELLKKRGVKVILITSAPFSEVEHNAFALLPCRVNINGIKNSAVAPVSVTDYLCNAVAAAGGDGTLDYMKQSELLFPDFTF